MVDGSMQAASLRAAAEAYREQADTAFFVGSMNTLATIGDSWFGKNTLTDDKNLLSGGGKSALAAALGAGGLARNSAQALQIDSTPWYSRYG